MVELKNNLQLFNEKIETPIKNKDQKGNNEFALYLNEIKSILNSLGYVDNEINDSIQYLITNEKDNNILVSSLTSEAKTELMDKHLKEILIRLSQKGS